MAKNDLNIKLVILGVRLLNETTVEIRLGPSQDNPGNSFSIMVPLDQGSFYTVGSTILSTVVK